MALDGARSPPKKTDWPDRHFAVGRAKHAFITYLPRDPRTEPNRAESSHKITRAKPRDKSSPADRAELRVQPEPRVNFEPQVKPESSRIKHRGEQRFEPSRFPNKAESVPDPESGLEPN